MKNCIIVYQSKTGFTKKYANWVQEELNCAITTLKSVKKGMLAPYDIVIFGTFVRVEKIHGIKEIKALIGKDADKKLVLFVTGATPPGEKAKLQKTWEESLSNEELEVIPHFYMESGLNYEKMGFGERMMMKSLKSMLAKKKDKTPEEEAFEKMLGRSYDNSSKEYIKPLIKYLKKK